MIRDQFGKDGRYCVRWHGYETRADVVGKLTIEELDRLITALRMARADRKHRIREDAKDGNRRSDIHARAKRRRESTIALRREGLTFTEIAKRVGFRAGTAAHAVWVDYDRALRRFRYKSAVKLRGGAGG